MRLFFRIFKTFLLLWAFSAGQSSVFAQKFPVTVSTTLMPPYSVWMADYTQPGSNKLSASVNFLDFNEPSFDVKLRVKIEGSGITLQTLPTFTPNAPITLSPGMPLSVNGDDLAPYLDYDNLSFSGITRQQLESTGQLPEGQYTFCIEVLDYLTGKPISQPGCASAWIQLKDQPLVISPQCGTAILPDQNPNIIFQWQNSGSLSQNSAFSTEYQLTIHEVTDANTDPMLAITNQKVLEVFSSGFQNATTYVYSQSDPNLDLGKKYVFRVQAQDENGFDAFKNEGFSEVCWFSYGYPENGTITLTGPEDGFHFTKEDLPYFKWSSPDNMLSGQQVTYTLAITEIMEGQTATAAMANNTPWKEVVTAPSGTPNGFDALLQDSIPKAKNFAWQIRATSGTQTVATSDIYTFTGPPFMEEFKAGEHTVVVSELESNDLDALSGKGFIRIGEGDSGKVEVEFADLEINQVAGKFVLDNGEILYDVASMPSIALEAKHEDVPDGVFHPSQIRLNKNELSISGTVKIPLPLAVNSNQVPYFVTAPTWFNFDSYKLKGSQFAAENVNTFELLDPNSFTVTYNETSEVVVSDNEFILDLKGEITLPSALKTPEGTAVTMAYSEQDNFNYGTIRAISDVEILLMNGATIYMKPNEAVLDFSSNESPGTLSAEKDWTGLYFTKSSLVFPTAFDASGQMVMAAEKEVDIALGNSYITTNYVSGLGHGFEAHFTSTNELFASVNAFKGRIKNFDLKMEESTITSGQVLMETVLPLVNSNKLFEVKLPIEEDGFGQAYFPETITETIVFDEEDEQRRMDIQVSNLSFDEEGQLDMAVDVSNTYTGFSVTGLSNFKVDATGNVGFNEVGLPLALETTASASLGGIPLDVDSIMFGKVGGNYGVALGASMNLGIAASGEGGELRTTLVSAYNYVAPEASAGATADIAGSFDAATMTGNINAQMSAEASGSAAGVSGGASGGAGAGASIGNGQISANAEAGASANVDFGLANKLIGGVNAFTGGMIKEQSYEVALGAGAGGTAGVTEHGFLAEANVYVDLVIASASGEVKFEVDERWGGVMMGAVAVDGKFIKIKYIEGIDGKIMLGMKDMKPISLIQGQISTAIPVFPPKIGITQFGFAAGTHTAPETFMPEDYTELTAMEYNIDMGTPLFMVASIGISDFIPGFEGIIYKAHGGVGGRIEGNIDLSNPASLTDLRVCFTGSIGGGIANISSGILENFLADKSAIAFDGTMDYCFGKIMEIKGMVDASLMLTVGIPPIPGVPICGEAPIDVHFRANFGEIHNPPAFLEDFIYEINYGTEQEPLNITFLCDPGMKLAKGWFNLKLHNGSANFKVGLGIEIDKHFQMPNIPVPTGHIAPYFAFQAELVGETSLGASIGSITDPAPSASLGLKVHASFYTSAGVKYEFLGIGGDLNLGTLSLTADGIFEMSTSGNMLLAGDFTCSVSVVGKSFDVHHTGSLPISI